jgi:hypothetical protein
LFRNVNRFEVQINNRSSIESFRYLLSLIDFSHLVAVKLDIISNTRTSVRDFGRQPSRRNNHVDNNEYNFNIENICSIIPRHVKQLDVTVKNVDEMITVLTQLKHLHTVVFRLAIDFPGRPQEILAWLQNKAIDYTYHYEYRYLSIWLGKTMTHRQPLIMTPPHKRAKILHRYDAF